MMCKLCEIQKWSHRVSTMLPWLVIPLIGLWALSQMFPPAFRFEITSSRLACVFVLLVTLFWYEILMPQLSAWRVHRNARLRERERLEAIEYDKLRKTAIRRCRNCSTPYRDQNPGGGRFMCSYCGHVSKRPVLDLPAPSGSHQSNSGIIKDLVTKGGKVCSENHRMCRQDWLENGILVNGPFKGYRRRSSGGFLSTDNQCLAEKSFSCVVILACKMLTSFLLSIRWLWRTIFRVSTSGDDASLDVECRGILTKRSDIGSNFHETRGEKARRKAEEKRQARLEKELLEEEERKQREEVARLVEERRRMRDERMGADKDCRKGSVLVKEKDGKKDVEKKCQERRREKEKVACKINSGSEEIDRRPGKENEKKHEFDNKSDIDRRENHKTGMEGAKVHGIEMGHGKCNTANNLNRGNTGSRYFDRMKGTFLSPSKAFSGRGFFGKGSSNAVAVTGSTVSKDSRFSGFEVQPSSDGRDSCAPQHSAGKLNMNGNEKSIHHPAVSDSQPVAAPKKSWHELFARSSAVSPSTNVNVPPSTNVNVISRQNMKFQGDGQGSQLAVQSPLSQSFDNPINFGLSSPFTLPTFPSDSASSACFPSTTHSILPRAREAPCNFLPEDPDIFEDPCYVPDPVSLLGPVSESLENFQLDLGAGFTTDIEIQRPRGLKNVSASSEVNRPSPIESPMSKLRSSDERHASSNRFQGTPKAQDLHTYHTDDSCNANDRGTWQMWNSSPLGQDGLGLVTGTTGWLLPPQVNRSNKEDIVHPSSNGAMGSLFKKEVQVLSGSHSPLKVFTGNGQNSVVLNPLSGSGDHDPWFPSAVFQPLSGGDSHLYVNPLEETAQNEVIYRSPKAAVANHHLDVTPANSWPKKEWGVPGSSVGAAGNTSAARSPTYNTPDVQSLFSYE